MSTTARWNLLINRLSTDDLAFILSELGHLNIDGGLIEPSKGFRSLQNLHLMLDQVQFQLDNRQLVLQPTDPSE
jgi:hypothetical protein